MFCHDFYYLSASFFTFARMGSICSYGTRLYAFVCLLLRGLVDQYLRHDPVAKGSRNSCSWVFLGMLAVANLSWRLCSSLHKLTALCCLVTRMRYFVRYVRTFTMFALATARSMISLTRNTGSTPRLSWALRLPVSPVPYRVWITAYLWLRLQQSRRVPSFPSIPV